MNRRTFLTSIGAASTAGTVVVRGDQPKTVPIVAVDVLIIGGGTAGTIAAIQAGRLGARTMLVEAGSQLGGTTTTAGVDFPGLFHAWGRQVIAGIGWELVTAAVKLNGDTLPDFAKPIDPQRWRHWRHQVRICGALYAALAEEACGKAGVLLRYYETPTAVEASPGGWKVRLVGKGTTVDIAARQLVDCTGNAAVVGLAGLPRLREKETQPGTLIYRLGGYSLGSPGLEPADLPVLQKKVNAAVKAGELHPTDLRGVGGFLAGGGENAMHVLGADSSTSETHTATNIRGRQSLLRVMRFLRQQPGFSGLCIERLQPETGVRETYRIIGETRVTENDYVTGRTFEDAVSYSFYPIDLHVESGVTPRYLPEGILPTVPRGALIPRNSKNLLVAGRCLCSDRLANSALRVQASCMGMGQAVGVIAALAATSATTPLAVPLATVRAKLREHGAVVPG
jgi:glycine/D-amino acid oxidase-like deaminating enzyme